MLADGKWSAPENQSVQFDGDVSIVMDLGAVIDLREVSAAVFERRGSKGFVTGSMRVRVSDDRQQWTLIKKARVLDVNHEFSHFRAVAMALEALGDRSTAPVLAELLAKEGVAGHSISMGPDIPVVPKYANTEGDKERTKTLRELALARALYRLGDFNGIGERILKAYANDPRGAYAAHAGMVLDGKREQE